MPKKKENAGYRIAKLLHDPRTIICWSKSIDGYTTAEQRAKIADEYIRTHYKTNMNTVYELMLFRCYNIKRLVKNPMNWGTIVSDIWLYDRLNFYGWYKENYYSVKGENTELDKDLLGNGEIYSADTCVFLPKKLNRALANTLSIKHNSEDNTYYFDDRKYPSEDAALNAYIAEKIDHIEGIYKEYKAFLPEYVKKALENYSLSVPQLKEQQQLKEYRRKLRKQINDTMTDSEKLCIILQGVSLPNK